MGLNKSRTMMGALKDDCNARSLGTYLSFIKKSKFRLSNDDKLFCDIQAMVAVMDCMDMYLH